MQTRLWLHTKDGTEEIVFEIVDQYMLEADAFAKAIFENSPVPTSLQDAVNNMKAIEAIFESSKDGAWKEL
jgi:predicted dehydrogenase